jgi:hypothetical protein
MKRFWRKLTEWTRSAPTPSAQQTPLSTPPQPAPVVPPPIVVQPELDAQALPEEELRLRRAEAFEARTPSAQQTSLSSKPQPAPVVPPPIVVQPELDAQALPEEELRLRRAEAFEARIPEWEQALEGKDLLSYGQPLCPSTHADGVLNLIGSDWYELTRKADLKLFLPLYDAVNTYCEDCQFLHRRTARSNATAIKMLIRICSVKRKPIFQLFSQAQLNTLGDDPEPYLALCRKNQLRLVYYVPSDDDVIQYDDWVSGDTFEVYVTYVPGSVDDAATYAVLNLRRQKKQEL